MEKEDLVKSANGGLSVRLINNYELVHNFEMFEHLLDSNMQIGVSNEEDEVLSIHNDDEMNEGAGLDENQNNEHLVDSNLQIGVSNEEDEVLSIHNDDEMNEGAGLDENQNNGSLTLPDNDTSGTSEIDNLSVIEARDTSLKQESGDIDNNSELVMECSRKEGSQHRSKPGVGTEHDLVVGMEFSDVYACRRALKYAASALCFKMKRLKSDQSRLIAKCTGEGCPWRIYCHKLPDASIFTVRSFHGSHTCGVSYLGDKLASALLNADVVAEKLNHDNLQEDKVVNLEGSSIHNDDEMNEGAGLDENQNNGSLSFPDNDDSGTPETDNLTVTGSEVAILEQESQDIDNNSDVGKKFSRKAEMVSPSSQQCSNRGVDTEHELVVGMEFSDVYACRRALKNAAIALCFKMKRINSDQTRLIAKCIGEGCPWRIYCHKLPDASIFTVRTIHGSHTCGVSYPGHKLASALSNADVVAEKLNHEEDEVLSIHNDDEMNEGAGLDENQNNGSLSFPDNGDSVTPEIDNLTVTESEATILKQESQDINNNSELRIELSRKAEMVSPSSQQCSSPRVSTEQELVVGMEFPDVYACRRAILNVAVALRFETKTLKSDQSRVIAKCTAEGCPWRIYFAKRRNAPTFTIRTIHGSHTCGGVSHHKQASPRWIANVFEEKLKENPHLKPNEILEEIYQVHGIELSYRQAWYGKARIVASSRVLFEEEYRLLPRYCDEIRRTNPGSIALVHVNPNDGTFQHLFISFQASISGFVNACRPLIALDKTFLESRYRETLLLATGFDGDGALFPLAFAIVNKENDTNWHRFLSELRKVLVVNPENIPELTILSSRERFIVDGVEANFPTAHHGFCLHHLTTQFRKEFKSYILVNLLWEAAHSLTVLEFKSKMNKIEQISPEASLWIQNISPTLWASSYFKGTRFGHLTANVITKSLSNWIQDTSGLPIIQMVECIHNHMMNMFKERRESSSHWSGILVPSAEKQMVDATEQSRVHRVYRANKAEFEVMTREGNVIVNIENRTCVCRRWDVYGFPCSHAIGALLSCKEDVYKYTESCLTVESYRRIYAETIEPVSDKEQWKRDGEKRDGENVVRIPKAMRGAPRKRVRTEDRDPLKRVMHCGQCNQPGHFKTTCSASM